MTTTERPLILASGSPRRRQLLAEAGYAFSVHPADVDETPPDASPTDVPRLLAERKAHALVSQFPDHLILAADTVVDLDGTLLNKPADEAEARAMLTRLQGRPHLVHTGVCLLRTHLGHDPLLVSFHETSVVHTRPADAEAIAYYVQHHRPLDKAGAYGVQDWWGLRHVYRIEGCFYNVMGLPMPRLSEVLASLPAMQSCC